MKLTDLHIPVNPEFDWSIPATEQLEYVNPVTLNNWTILLANYGLEVSQSIVGVNRKIRDRKKARAAAKHAFSDFQQDLLREYPPPALATKNLALTDAYIRNTAFVAGRQEEYNHLQIALSDADQALEHLDIELDNARQVWDTIKLMGIHIQTHLSFLKSDMKKAGLYT
jgi:hypothetical protein